MLRICFLILFSSFPTFANCGKSPFIYQVQTANGSVTLLGTFHLGVRFAELELQPKNFIQKFTSVTVESSSKAYPYFYDLKFNREEMAQSGRPPLRDLLTLQEMIQLKLEIRKAWNLSQVNTDYLYYLHPQVANFIVGLAWMVRNNHSKTMDMEIESLSEHHGIPINYLENFTQAVLDMAPAWRDHVKELKFTLADPSVVTSYLPAYCEGDVRAYSVMLANYKKNFSDSYHRLFTERNQKWFPKLMDLTKTPGHHLVAVGNGHLLGEDGLLESFRKEGFLFKRTLIID